MRLTVRSMLTLLAAAAAGFGGAVAVSRATDKAPVAVSVPRTAAAFALGERELAVRDAGRVQGLPPLHHPPKHVETVMVDPPVTGTGGTTTVPPPTPTNPPVTHTNPPVTHTVAPPPPPPPPKPSTIISN